MLLKEEITPENLINYLNNQEDIKEKKFSDKDYLALILFFKIFFNSFCHRIFQEVMGSFLPICRLSRLTRRIQ